MISQPQCPEPLVTLPYLSFYVYMHLVNCKRFFWPWGDNPRSERRIFTAIKVGTLRFRLLFFPQGRSPCSTFILRPFYCFIFCHFTGVQDWVLQLFTLRPGYLGPEMEDQSVITDSSPVTVSDKFPFHVAVWKNDTSTLRQLCLNLKNKVSVSRGVMFLLRSLSSTLFRLIGLASDWLIDYVWWIPINLPICMGFHFNLKPYPWPFFSTRSCWKHVIAMAEQPCC